MQEKDQIIAEIMRVQPVRITKMPLAGTLVHLHVDLKCYHVEW